MASLLILVTIALLLPAVFDFTSQHLTGGIDLSIADEQLSIGVAAVLLLLYVANLIYTLRTHKDMFAPAEPREPSEERSAWPLRCCLFLF